MESKSPKQRPVVLASFITIVMLAATVAVASPASAADNCGAQFNESNAPDHASCTFSCKGTQKLVIGVDASDDDAVASGSARCGGGYSPCRPASGANSCYGEEGVAGSESASGTCSAVVDEFWNSAWSYNCASRDIDPNDPPNPPNPPTDPDNCIWGVICCPSAVCEGTTGPTIPCEAPYASRWEAPTPKEIWDRVGLCGVNDLPRLADPLSGLPAGVTSRIDVWVSASGVATGRLCNAGVGCWSILPVCVSDPTLGRMECSVPETPKILGPSPLYGA